LAYAFANGRNHNANECAHCSTSDGANDCSYSAAIRTAHCEPHANSHHGSKAYHCSNSCADIWADSGTHTASSCIHHWTDVRANFRTHHACHTVSNTVAYTSPDGFYGNGNVDSHGDATASGIARTQQRAHGCANVLAVICANDGADHISIIFTNDAAEPEADIIPDNRTH
jgi:hypothetical protein